MIRACRKMPIFVIVSGVRVGTTAALTWTSDRPDIATFVADRWDVAITLDGLFFGRYQRWDEPYGTATVQPAEAPGPCRWLRIDATVAKVRFLVSGHTVADAVAAMHRATFVPPCRDGEHEWPHGLLRGEGL